MKAIQIIQKATEVSYAVAYPIEDFSIQDLIELSSLAKEAKVEIKIQKETSNAYQGTLVEVQRIDAEDTEIMEFVRACRFASESAIDRIRTDAIELCRNYPEKVIEVAQEGRRHGKQE